MIELAIYACLAEKPSICREAKMIYAEVSTDPVHGITLQQCQSAGMFEVAKWAGEHPHLVVRKWNCGIAGQYAKI